MFGPDVRTLSATGHPAVDTPALKRALDQLSYPSAAEPYDWRTGTLLLHHGDCPEGFRIDAPLSINSYDTCTQLSPPRVIGLGHVRIRYAGAETDAPVLSVFGRPAGGRAVAPLLENLFFNCARRCRGPLLHNQVYRPLARDCLCYASREIGWDLVDCWGGSLQNVHAISVDGIALRAHRFNSGRIDGLRASNLDAAQWPGEHDTSVLDAAGNPVQTSPEQRALLVIQGNDNQITQTILENCRGAMPLLHYRGFVARFAGIRLEDNDLGGPTFVVDGRARRDGHHVTFSFIRGHDQESQGPGGKLPPFLLRGDTRAVRIADCELFGYRNAIVRVEGGRHCDLTLERIETEADEIPKHAWIASDDAHLITTEGNDDVT